VRPTVRPDQLRRWGVDTAWSRTLSVLESGSASGAVNTWHVLDSGDPPRRSAIATVVCVHGNPTWSYLWRSFHHRLGDRYRVVAVDQLGMGLSDRTARRRFATRVDDLGDVIAALDIDGPVVLAAHDWGGPISLGWALRNRDRVAGAILCNTGVAVPAGRRAPALIRLAASGPITDVVGHRTRLFVDGTLALSGKRVSALARAGFRAPYRHAADRQAIADFVDDVPFTAAHPSAAAIAAVADGIREMTVPVLLAHGGRDPVFDDSFAADLAERLPHADRHRFGRAGHLVVEEMDVAGLADSWLADRVAKQRPAPRQTPVAASTAHPSDPAAPAGPIWSALVARAGDESPGFVDGATGESTSFAELHRRVMGTAAGLAQSGVRPGDRVAVLVLPGTDLLTTVFGCWRAGAVTVIADRGLGLRGLGAAVRAARVDWVIGAPPALAAARALRWAVGARRISVASLAEMRSSTAPLPPEPQPEDLAAVLYTSGATGPAKGVRYRHAQMCAQRDAVRDTYSIGPDDRLVAAFAPFALYGPALGITSTIPDVDVTKPGTLSVDALVAAVESVAATIVFAAPAALANVNRTARSPGRAEQRLEGVRLVLSAGAPVPIATLRATAQLVPSAELHTPYGMTECLPVADVSLTEIDAAGAGRGVCVGPTVSGADVMIAALGFDAGRPVTALAVDAMGEILARTPWVSDGYDRLWRTQRDARPRDVNGVEWHRTGDVGHLDRTGRLWVEGRSVHVVHTADGPVTPVPVEIAVERLAEVERAAAVAVGPAGCQQLVVFVEGGDRGVALASDALSRAVRGAVDVPVAAVLTVSRLPVDIRHNTKIDRTLLARCASAILAGGRGRLTS
jgi:olefin beta-lactone synthetase